ncbi:hypothetical protein B0T17DRAFT_6684 [Bombardia bombarda]|uniref:Uncharacterized protein n=1 Tax=Bombardia bombarda TaxID=252184 RepID=A0AA40CEG7_9PEZI|nr:hypothetical protein B0T17DRAFT_6684 [Bombardia bombarda]
MSPRSSALGVLVHSWPWSLAKAMSWHVPVSTGQPLAARDPLVMPAGFCLLFTLLDRRLATLVQHPSPGRNSAPTGQQHSVKSVLTTIADRLSALAVHFVSQTPVSWVVRHLGRTVVLPKCGLQTERSPPTSTAIFASPYWVENSASPCGTCTLLPGHMSTFSKRALSLSNPPPISSWLHSCLIRFAQRKLRHGGMAAWMRWSLKVSNRVLNG